MALEYLINLQKEFNLNLVTPLCNKYIFYLEKYLNKGYKKNTKPMALSKVRSEIKSGIFGKVEGIK